jgi:competence protein ComEC
VSRTRVDVGPLVACGALALGIVVGERAGGANAGGTLLFGVALLGASALVARWPRVAIAALAFVCLGAGVTQRALHGLNDSTLVRWRDAHAIVTARGTLVSDPDGSRFAVDALVHVSSFVPAGDATDPTRADRIVLVRASGREVSALQVAEMGDHIVVTGRLEALDGYDARLRWRHAVARIVDARIEMFHPPASLLLRAANVVRSTTMRGAVGLRGADRALFAGFVLGDTRDISPSIRADFRDAGLSHLLAVSGANVAFVLALAAPLLRRCRLWSRAALGCAVVVVFAAATRFEPSVLRASVMALVAMAAMLAGRPVPAMRLLALAVIALLLADPFLLHSVGFLLSVGATAGIAGLSAPVARRLRGPRWFRETLAVTLAAQVGVAPVMFPVFGSMPAITPVANLLAVPVAEPVTVYGLCVSFVLALGAPLRPLAPALHAPTAVMLTWVALVARTSARVGVEVQAGTAAFILCLACVAMAAVLWKRGATLRVDAQGPGDTAERFPAPAPR